MNNIETCILNNDFKTLKESILSFEHQENHLRSVLSPLIDKYGLIVIYILIEVAYSRGISFWFNQIGYFLSFGLSHVNGAERMSLAMFKKSFEIEPNDILTIKGILDFKYPPEIILTDLEYDYYSNILEEKEKE